MSDGVRKEDVEEPVDTLLQLLGQISQGIDTYAHHNNPGAQKRAKQEIKKHLKRLEEHLAENEDYYSRLFRQVDRQPTRSDLDSQHVERIEQREIRMLKAYGIHHRDLDNLQALYEAYQKETPGSPIDWISDTEGGSIRSLYRFVEELVEDAIEEVDASRDLKRIPKKKEKNSILLRVVWGLGGAGLYGANSFAPVPLVQELSQDFGVSMIRSAISGD